jgi:hypothetical protein
MTAGFQRRFVEVGGRRMRHPNQPEFCGAKSDKAVLGYFGCRRVWDVLVRKSDGME